MCYIRYMLSKCSTDKVWQLPKVVFLKYVRKPSNVNPPFHPTVISSFLEINLAFYHLHVFISCNSTY